MTAYSKAEIAEYGDTRVTMTAPQECQLASGRVSRSRIVLRRCLTLACAGSLAVTLAACSHETPLTSTAALHLADPEQRHPIEFAIKQRSLEIELPHGRQGLLAAQISDVHRFVSRFKAEANGRLQVSAPASPADRDLVNRVILDISEIAGEQGVPRRSIEVVRAPGSGGGWPSVKLSYDRPVAVAPDCGNWPENVAVDYDRVPYENYGCATQRNLAAMIDNPRDLMAPRAETSRSSERRQKGWEKYVTGSGGKSDSGSDKGGEADKGGGDKK